MAKTVSEIVNIINELPEDEQEYYSRLLDQKQKSLQENALRQSKELDLVESVKQLTNLSERQNRKLINAISSITLKVPEQKASKKQKVEVVNLQEVRPIKFPASIGIKRPAWIDAIVSKITDRIPTLDKPVDVKADLDRYTEEDNPLAVRLSNGSKFINQIASVGGNIISKMPLPFTTSFSAGGKESRALVDQNGYVFTRDWLHALSNGQAPGFDNVVVFGRNENLLNSLGDQDISGLGGTYAFLDTATTLFISSTSASDVGNLLFIDMLDANYGRVLVFGFTNGQSQVAISGGPHIHVQQAFNLGSTPLQGDIYIAESDDLTGGVPDTVSKRKLIIKQGNEVSQGGRYIVPDGKLATFESYTTTVGKGGDATFNVALGAFSNDVFIKGFPQDLYENSTIVNVKGMAGVTSRGAFKAVGSTTTDGSAASTLIFIVLQDE